MKKLLNVLFVTTLTVMTFSQAEAGRGANNAEQPNQGAGGGQGAGGVQAPTGVDLGWCRGKNHCVLISLPSSPGRTGSLKLYSLNSDGSAYNTTLSSCPATGGFDTHPDGARSKKTPAGTHSVIDTGDQLLYNDRYVGMYNPTYFHDPDPSNLFTRNRIAIHSGHVAGSNSHGCVRTSSNCAATVRQKADEDQGEMKIRVVYF